MRTRDVKRAVLLAALVVAMLLAGNALARPAAGEQPVFLRAWGGEGEFLRRPNSLVVDDDKTIYVANSILRRITRLNTDGTYRNWGESGYGPGKFNDLPDGIVLDNGRLYVVDRTVPLVHVFDTRGVLLDSWGEPGMALGQISNPIDIDLYDGKVYVLDTQANRVSVFTIDGTFVTSWGSAGVGPGQFQGPQGIAVDGSRGWVYVIDPQSYRVQKFTLDGTFLLQWGSNGSGDDQFRYPFRVGVDSDGRVYVTDRNSDQVKAFNSAGEFLAKFGGRGGADGKFDSPRGIDIHSHPKSASDPKMVHDVYVADGARLQRFVIEWDESENASIVFNRAWGREEAEFFRPLSILYGRNGLLYTADRTQHTNTSVREMRRYDPYGALVSRWLWDGLGVVTGMTQDADGSVYFVHPNFHTIYKRTAEGDVIWQRGGPTAGSANNQFSRPQDVAVNDLGLVLVADTNNNRVQVYDINGTYQRTMANPGSGPGQFILPRSLAFDGDGNVYLFELGGMRVQKYDPNGAFLMEWGGEGTAEGNFGRPRTDAGNDYYTAPNMAIRGDEVFITDPINHRIQVFTREGVFVTAWGSAGSGAGQFEEDLDVTFAPNGDIYVSDSGNNSIQVFNFDTPTDDPAARLIVNGDMEAFMSPSGWAYSVELDRTLPTSRVAGAATGGAGNFVMQLGRPVPAVDQGQKVAWASQTIYVHPAIERPRLTFDYNWHTNDVLGFAALQLEVLDGMGINSLDAQRFGYASCDGNAPAPGTASGWRSYEYDLAPYSGQTIRVAFSIRNAWPNSLGMWALLDNVAVVSAAEQMQALFIPSVIADNCPG